MRIKMDMEFDLNALSDKENAELHLSLDKFKTVVGKVGCKFFKCEQTYGPFLREEEEKK